MYDRIYDKLCDILEDMERKEKLTASDMQIIDWATHSIKSMLATEEMGGTHRGNSYANRKRDSMGRYAREGRSYRGYSRKDDFIEQMHDMMESAPNEMTRQSIQRMITQMEQD